MKINWRESSGNPPPRGGGLRQLRLTGANVDKDKKLLKGRFTVERAATTARKHEKFMAWPARVHIRQRLRRTNAPAIINLRGPFLFLFFFPSKTLFLYNLYLVLKTLRRRGLYISTSEAMRQLTDIYIERKSEWNKRWETQREKTYKAPRQTEIR